MHNKEVIAYTGSGDKKREVGRKTIQLADNMKEAVQISGSEKSAVDFVNRMITTNTRNTLARPAGGSQKEKILFETAQKLVAGKVPWETITAATQFTAASYSEKCKALGL